MGKRTTAKTVRTTPLYLIIIGKDTMAKTVSTTPLYLIKIMGKETMAKTVRTTPLYLIWERTLRQTPFSSNLDAIKT